MEFEGGNKRGSGVEEMTSLTPKDNKFWRLPTEEIVQGLLAASDKRLKETDLLNKIPREKRFESTRSLSALIRDGKISRELEGEDQFLTLTPGSPWYEGSFRSISEWHRRDQPGQEKSF